MRVLKVCVVPVLEGHTSRLSESNSDAAYQGPGTSTGSFKLYPELLGKHSSEGRQLSCSLAASSKIMKH